MNREGIQIVMDDFIKSGHGEWEDPEVRTRCRIMWRKPEQLASDIYDWAVAMISCHRALAVDAGFFL